MRSQFLFLGLVCLLGCSGEDEKKTRTREEFCREWAVQACSTPALDKCVSTVETCRTAQQEFCATLVPTSFSGEQSDECLAAVGSAYSDGDLTAAEARTVLQLDAPCDHLVRGPKGQGEPCTDTDDCNAASGLECVKKGGSATGSCEVPVTVGAGLKCDAPQQVCAEGFYCNGDNCIQQNDVGDDCASHEQCSAETYCSDAGACEARHPRGIACVSDFECISDLCYTFSAGSRLCTDRVTLAPNETICDQLR